ncbi:N-acetylglucosamine-6-phosphate deacetylase [Nibrella saemangeumensis]|uniref:N-acetylglucosamine-6-phosphate deacetylase n=1 Tax=Nibrella saemangeumensis TaxID=1084526 RepID=A0ABP8MBS3_9BACT
MNATFHNATIFTGSELLPNMSVHINYGRILAISYGVLDGEHIVDLQGNYLLPGFVDLQLYGGSQQYLNEHPTAETVRHIYETHRKNGTTSVVPTLYSTSHQVILRAIEAVRTVQRENPFGVLGLHVEGPYINPEKRGAHSLNYVRQPNDSELGELFDQGADVIKLLTIAPEIFSEEQLDKLFNLANSTSTLLSLGHSNATYQQATNAFNSGIPLATHLYNAMRGFESREPVTIGAIFDHPSVRASLIADGFHCDPVAIRIAHRQLGNRLFLISDATFANPPRPELAYEDFIIRYENDRYTNQEGKLAGSSITLLDAVKVCVDKAGLPLTEALRMASTTPAEIIGAATTLGRVQTGYVANLVVLDQALSVQRVITA